MYVCMYIHIIYIYIYTHITTLSPPQNRYHNNAGAFHAHEAAVPNGSSKHVSGLVDPAWCPPQGGQQRELQQYEPTW